MTHPRGPANRLYMVFYQPPGSHEWYSDKAFRKRSDAAAYVARSKTGIIAGRAIIQHAVAGDFEIRTYHRSTNNA